MRIEILPQIEDYDLEDEDGVVTVGRRQRVHLHGCASLHAQAYVSLSADQPPYPPGFYRAYLTSIPNDYFGSPDESVLRHCAFEPETN